MELKDTIELMLDDDWRIRLGAEYLQLDIRIQKLERYLENNQDDLLSKQIGFMREYRKVLIERMNQAGIFDILQQLHADENH